MKIVHADEIAFERGLEYRGGLFHSQRLLAGEPGTPGNFSFGIGRTVGDFFSPRHRHNFEQIRYQIAGTLDFGRTGRMTPGMVGYFPEGVPYGPQSQKAAETTLTAVLQFGGPSGSGYLSGAEVKAGMAALEAQGSFAEGVFHRAPGLPGKRNLDAFQAIWEHVNGRPLVYPQPRYTHPILMDPAHYDWVAVADAPGVTEKPLGIFTERRSQVRLLELAPDAAATVAGRAVLLVLAGTGTVADEGFRPFTALHLEADQSARFLATTAATLLHLGLPDFTGLHQSRPVGGIAEAAE